MDETLQFIVMVEGKFNDSQLLNSILGFFPDARRVKSHSCDIRGNWLEIWENKEADPALASGDDGYLFFDFRVEVSPLDASIDEEHQTQLARDLRTCFGYMGAQTVVCANFEDRV